MSTTLFLVSMVIITALLFDFTNGFHPFSERDGTTSVATGGVETEGRGVDRRGVERGRARSCPPRSRRPFPVGL